LEADNNPTSSNPSTPTSLKRENEETSLPSFRQINSQPRSVWRNNSGWVKRNNHGDTTKVKDNDSDEDLDPTLKEGILEFNKKWKTGIQYLKNNGLIGDSAESISSFFNGLQ